MNIMEKKKYKELERIWKGVASHRRIQIIDLLDKQAELSVFDIAENVSHVVGCEYGRVRSVGGQ